jgi:hypothetical protein
MPIYIFRSFKRSDHHFERGVAEVKLIDELFEMYRDKLTADEEDLDMVTFAVLEDHDREDLLEIVKEMDEYELKYFIRLYLFETLKGKIAQLEGRKDDPSGSCFRPLH